MPPRPDSADAVPDGVPDGVAPAGLPDVSEGIAAGVPADWPLALRLLIALCRAGVAADGAGETAGDRDATGPDAANQDAANQDAAVLVRAMGPDDWDALPGLAIAQHLVAPTAAPALAQLGRAVPGAVPEAVQDALDMAAQRATAAVLAQMAQTRRITTALAPLGIEPAVLKGWPLGALYQGGAALRHSGDLDLMIRYRDLGPALGVLADLGYAPLPGHAGIAALAGRRVLERAEKDIELYGPAAGVGVELHWRAFRFRAWPDPLTAPDALARRDTPSGTVLCPTDRTNLVLLTIHGLIHRWYKLKWLVDIDRLVRHRGPDALAADLAWAGTIGAHGQAALGLRLAARLLGTPLPRDLPVQADGTRRLERAMLGSIRHGGAAGDGLTARIAHRLSPLLASRALGGPGTLALAYGTRLLDQAHLALVVRTATAPSQRSS